MEIRPAADCFKERLQELVASEGLTYCAAAKLVDIGYEKFRRWCSRGIAEPDKRTWAELEKVAEYFGVGRAVYLWASREAATEIERFMDGGDWQVYCGHPNLDLQKVVEFSERMRNGEHPYSIRKSVRWKRPEQKASLQHLAIARDAAATVEETLLSMPEQVAQEADKKIRQVLEEFGTVKSVRIRTKGGSVMRRASRRKDGG